MSDDLRRAVDRYAAAHADADGVAATPIPGVVMMRLTAPSGMLKVVHRPLLCLVLQGAKTVSVGEAIWRFGAGQSFIVSVDVPAIGRVVQASAPAPYLSLALDLDMAVMRAVMGEMAAAPPAPASVGLGLFVDDIDAALMECGMRLVRLLDRPEAAPILQPAIVREMHYWLLVGRHGAALRRLAAVDGHAQRIARAVALLRRDFARPVAVARLAEAAGMSASSFHTHFKAVTSVSPLQFQKQLRLLEARRLMVSEGVMAREAAFAVGYESVSQFTREYGRMFGASPRRSLAVAA
jgi:AraC-like DNA-binding protein